MIYSAPRKHIVPEYQPDAAVLYAAARKILKIVNIVSQIPADVPQEWNWMPPSAIRDRVQYCHACGDTARWECTNRTELRRIRSAAKNRSYKKPRIFTKGLFCTDSYLTNRSYQLASNPDLLRAASCREYSPSVGRSRQSKGTTRNLIHDTISKKTKDKDFFASGGYSRPPVASMHTLRCAIGTFENPRRASRAVARIMSVHQICYRNDTYH